MKDRLHLGHMSGIALWAALSAVAWAVGSGLLLSHSISDPAQIRGFAIDIALQALITGTLIGVGGAVSLRQFLRRPLAWALGALVALPAGLTVGFLADAEFLTRQVHSMGMALSGEGGGAFFGTSPPIELIVAGMVLGLFQLPSLATGLATRWVTVTLWVAGVAAALGSGWFISAALVGGGGTPSLAQGASMGVVSGLLIGVLLLALETDLRRRTTGWRRPA